jgi:hypothetical protein
MRVRSEDGETVRAHREVIARSGTAMLGKFGKPVGKKVAADLNRQIDAGAPTYLFLTTREGWNGPYITYRCSLVRVRQELLEEGRALVPRYYAAANHAGKTWFEISSIDKLTRSEMNRIYVVSSGREIMSVINSSATSFIVAVAHPAGP